MTFTSRIRFCLVLIAILPVLIVMVLIWHQLQNQALQSQQRQAETSLAKFQIGHEASVMKLIDRSRDYLAEPSVRRTMAILRDSQIANLEEPVEPFDLDFAEIIDSNRIVKASFHRPGLLGRTVNNHLKVLSLQPETVETIEYDLNGPHASLTLIRPIAHNLYLYTGQYLNRERIDRVAALIETPIKLIFDPDTIVIYASMERQKLYQTDQGYQAVIAGSETVDYYLVAEFNEEIDDSALINLLGLAGLVGLMSVAISIAVGMYITGRASREIDNLVQATERISKGDLNTPIMAYEEGEFSKLADSFSQMIVDLKNSQSDLAESEKIAAWQTMGRKIAHEIKNPMTPIAISAEDLRRSYHENLPDFEQILDQTTSTIKSEVDRLARLLDQFVNFAKMAPPIIKPTEIDQLTDELKHFYKREIDEGRLSIKVTLGVYSFAIDRDNIWQVMINLIKNGLESGSNASVTISIEAGSEQFSITVEDDGPGFPDEILANSFQPHISTKKHGSGLGLVICHRIIRDHSGQLEIYNRPEGGAGIKVIIPA